MWLRLIVGLAAAPLALLFEIANWSLGVLDWEFKREKRQRGFVQAGSWREQSALPEVKETAAGDSVAPIARSKERPAEEILAEWDESGQAAAGGKHGRMIEGL